MEPEGARGAKRMRLAWLRTRLVHRGRLRLVRLDAVGRVRSVRRRRMGCRRPAKGPSGNGHVRAPGHALAAHEDMRGGTP